MQNRYKVLKTSYNRNHILKPIFFSIILIFSSCANMLVPTGGEKDIESPKLIFADPENYSTNKNPKKIILRFDEYIVLKNIENQLIISPGNIKNSVNKKSKEIEIDLKEDLKENTTYILNFGNSISDYTENNISKEFKYIFSTGNLIDSLNLKGKVIDAYTTEVLKDALVCLYINDTINDSVFYKRKPDYTTKTDEQGNFKFTNLRENKYKFYVLLESNNNKIYDSADEIIAFIDSTISLKNNQDLLVIKSFKEIPKSTKVLEKKTFYKMAVITLNKKYSNYSYSNLDINIDTVITNSIKDTITIYYKNFIDSSALILNYNDENKIDTILLKFIKKQKPINFQVDINQNIIDNSVYITSNNRITNIIPDSILLYQDSTKVNFSYTIENEKIIINYDFNDTSEYKLTVKDSSIIDYQNEKNKYISKKLIRLLPEDYGNIEIKFEGDINNKIIEVLNDKSIIVKKINLNEIQILSIKNILPGTYKLRIIEDSNNNYKWDTGNLELKLQPENIKYYTEPIKIRANWDLELIIKL